MKPAAAAMLGLSLLMLLAAVWLSAFWWQFLVTGLLFFVVAGIIAGNDEDKGDRHGDDSGNSGVR